MLITHAKSIWIDKVETYGDKAEGVKALYSPRKSRSGEEELETSPSLINSWDTADEAE